jgi:predicted  nucleic acid-binding Zn-ribbon protein
MFMNALMKKEDPMSVEDRLASLESDVKYLRNDMTDVKQHVRSLDNSLQSFKTEVAKEFGAVRAEAAGLRAEMNREFGAVRTEAAGLRAEMNKEFGAVRVSIESLKISIEKAKLWMLVSGVGVIMSTVVTLAHALKLF